MLKVLSVSTIYTVWITVLFFYSTLIRAENTMVNKPALVHKTTSTSQSVPQVIRERDGKQTGNAKMSAPPSSSKLNIAKSSDKKKPAVSSVKASRNVSSVQSEKVVQKIGAPVPSVAVKSSVSAPKELEEKTSGALTATRPSPRPVFVPVGTRVNSYPTTLRKSFAVIGDPLGTLDWFSLSWTPFMSLPRDSSEWDAWEINVEAQKTARLQAVLERREALLNAYIKRASKVATTLYYVRIVNQGQELFADRSLSVQQEAALKAQIFAEMERLQPSFDRIEETRSELGKLRARDTKPAGKYLNFDLRSNTAPSCWWLGGKVEKVLRSLHDDNPTLLMEAEKDAVQFERLLVELHGANETGTFQNDSLVTRPESFVPLDTPMPFFDSQLPLSTPELPKLTEPSVHGVEVTTTSLKARVFNLAPGTVEFAGAVPSCGVVVIVSHSGNLYSVFSFLAQTVVNQGQQLQKGSEIGIPGMLPKIGKDQRGCRFEVRFDDKPSTVTTLRGFRDVADLLQDPS